MLQRLVLIVACLGGVPAFGQTPLGTGFTYQGQLKGSGVPVVGTADFQFALFDAENGGSQIGSILLRENVAIVNGLFTTSLDFGAAALSGDNRWIDVTVRSPAGSGSFTPLSPRQPLTGTPYALQTRGLFVDSAGKVGIGTTNPAKRFHVRGTEPTMILQDTASAANQSGYIGFWNNAANETAWAGFGTPGSADFSVVNERSGGDINLLPGLGGRVGVATSDPLGKLHIKGQPNSPGGTLALEGTSSTFVAFYPNGAAAGRTAYMGYPGLPGNALHIANEVTDGNIELVTFGSGVTRVKVLEIVGADVAEKFPASEELEPGMVVAIDKQNPGKLCLARGAYNRCVAGIVSGANDFRVGAVLGSVPENKDSPAIALTGRVYVQCDSGSGAIEPGDLLTTSDIAGHAMKVTDYPRAQGAIIGKAMTGLKHGDSGMVLVLVSLQ